jgi:hypothetical protein
MGISNDKSTIPNTLKSNRETAVVSALKCPSDYMIS